MCNGYPRKDPGDGNTPFYTSGVLQLGAQADTGGSWRPDFRFFDDNPASFWGTTDAWVIEGMQVRGGQSGSGVWLNHRGPGAELFDADRPYLAGILFFGREAAGISPLSAVYGDISDLLGGFAADGQIDLGALAPNVLLAPQTRPGEVTGTILNERLIGSKPRRCPAGRGR